jgi:hypothetical protein
MKIYTETKRLVSSANIAEDTGLLTLSINSYLDHYLLYFWRNFSTLPAVSTIFCLPV